MSTFKKQRAPLPDFQTSFTHSCNNLASYESKKNKEPTKNPKTKGSQLSRMDSSTMSFVKSKVNFESKKDFSTSISEIKTFSRPNLDEGNRFFEDTRQLYTKFSGQEQQAAKRPQSSQVGAKKSVTFKTQGKATDKTGFIPVSHEAPFNARSYKDLGYTPKRYDTNEKSKVLDKYQNLKKTMIEKDLAQSTKRPFRKVKEPTKEADKPRAVEQNAAENKEYKQEEPVQEQPNEAPPQEQVQEEAPQAVLEPTKEQSYYEVEESSVDDGRQPFQVFAREEYHPLYGKGNDPRNQYVQHNNKFYQDDDQSVPKGYGFNNVKPFFKTNYKQSFSPKRMRKTKENYDETFYSRKDNMSYVMTHAPAQDKASTYQFTFGGNK